MLSNNNSNLKLNNQQIQQQQLAHKQEFNSQATNNSNSQIKRNIDDDSGGIGGNDDDDDDNGGFQNRGSQNSSLVNYAVAKRFNSTGGGRSISQQLDDEQQFEETQKFLKRTKEQAALVAAELERKNNINNNSKLMSLKRKAKLAREETIEEGGGNDKKSLNGSTTTTFSGCFKMFLNFIKKKRIFIPIIFISLIAAIYCLPFVDIETKIPQPLPYIPFNFRDGPLKASSASQFKIERLFYNQIYGPESIALDSMGNMYMAIEGGFILYAHLNKSSPIKKAYYDNASLINSRLLAQQQQQQQQQFESSFQAGNLQPLNQQTQLIADEIPELVKIAELNGIKQMPYEKFTNSNKRAARSGFESTSSSGGGGGLWKRECQLDEKVYGQQLASLLVTDESSSSTRKFHSNVVISRCSKPLGIRLSPDENYLYIIDTLNGLFKINLKISEKLNSSQRLVQKLIDFKSVNKNYRQLLPIVHYNQQDFYYNIRRGTSESTTTTSKRALDLNLNQNQNNINLVPQYNSQTTTTTTTFMNISLLAIDDLVIDYSAGYRGGDVIYMSDASQTWQALSFVYDMLEGRPSGAILRYDTGLNQLSVLNPKQVAHVRTSNYEINNLSSRLYSTEKLVNNNNSKSDDDENSFMGIGAPRLDENDVFDDRPLHFPNGLELMDNKEAILIADSINKRIIKHYIKGNRKGTSDLFAWTPNYPDNIRRGFDKNQETYWVAGCGEDTTNKYFDLLSWLNEMPKMRKFLLKNFYLFGWLIEQFGKLNFINSIKIRDFGYQLKIGSSLCQSMCPGMMMLQYNKYGDIIRSIYSKEFPNDLAYYSQINELIDNKNQEHILYLSSPSYNYVTKLILPTDSSYIPPPEPQTSFQSINR